VNYSLFFGVVVTAMSVACGLIMAPVDKIVEEQLRRRRGGGGGSGSSSGTTSSDSSPSSRASGVQNDLTEPLLLEEEGAKRKDGR